MSVASALVSFAAIALLLTITPGIDTAMVLRSTIAGGHRAGFATAFGVFVGVLAWGVAAAVGVSALLTTSSVTYDVLRFVGAAYLLWLGVRFLSRALRGDAAGARFDGDMGPTTPSNLWVCFRQGLLANLLNPKVGAFYVATIPQFLPDGVSHVWMGVALALVHNLEGLAWFSAVILGTHRLRAALDSSRARRRVDAVTGTALVGFGVRLALSAH
jgi:threonine/homoserine/homoserine lactone efflux protein